MRVLLLVPIYVYRHLLPRSLKRRECIFRETCSRYVSRVTRAEGLAAGWAALQFRRRNCRPGYRIHLDPRGRLEMQLVGGEVVGEASIADSVLAPYRRVVDSQTSSQSCVVLKNHERRRYARSVLPEVQGKIGSVPAVRR